MKKAFIKLSLLLLAALFFFVGSKTTNVDAATITTDSNGNWNWGYNSSFDFDSYYANVDTTSASKAKSSLHTILTNNITKLTYANVWTGLQKVDVSPNSSSVIICMYTGKTFATSATGSSGTTTWNREHTWAKSHGFGSNTTYYAYTDLNHLRATECFTNSKRSNYDFGVVTSSSWTDSYGNKLGTGSDGNTYFEPRDAVKGDIARIMLYMDVRYEGYSTTDNGINLQLTNGATTSSTSTTAYFGDKATLLKWAYQDPVDDLERMRNDLVYSVQGNRNPFIDHPEYMNTIYGTSYSFGTSSSGSGSGNSGTTTNTYSTYKTAFQSTTVSGSATKATSSSSSTTKTSTLNTFTGSGSYTQSKNTTKDCSSIITHDSSVVSSITANYNSNTSFYCKAGDIRLYSGSGKGTSLVLKAASGVTFTSVSVTAPTNSSYLTKTVSSDGSTITIQNTKNTTKNYAKISSITISYKTASSSSTTATVSLSYSISADTYNGLVSNGVSTFGIIYTYNGSTSTVSATPTKSGTSYVVTVKISNIPSSLFASSITANAYYIYNSSTVRNSTTYSTTVNKLSN